MSKTPTFVVWAWLYNGHPFYVGWGKHTPESCDRLATHPAARLFATRHDIPSRLNAWLRTLEAEPPRCNETARLGPFHKAVARSVCLTKREELIKLGYELFSSRGVDTFNGGGGARKIVGPEGIVFPSVRAAAMHVGVDNSTLTRWCQARDKGWRYHEELISDES